MDTDACCCFDKEIFNDETFWHSITYLNFHMLQNMGVKQGSKDSSLHKDSKYMQVYIVSYRHLGVTAVQIQSGNLYLS